MQKTLLTSLALLTLWPNAALATKLECPQPIRADEQLAESAPDGWSAATDASPRYLEGVSFFDGPPEKQASLAPTRDAKSGRHRVAVWTFGDGEVPVWVVCRYLSSGITLLKPLPTSYRECRVSYGAGEMITAIECR
jgi:hypothetical protein